MRFSKKTVAGFAVIAALTLTPAVVSTTAAWAAETPDTSETAQQTHTITIHGIYNGEDKVFGTVTVNDGASFNDFKAKIDAVVAAAGESIEGITYYWDAGLTGNVTYGYKAFMNDNFYFKMSHSDTVKVEVKDLKGNVLGTVTAPYDATFGSQKSQFVQLADANAAADPANYTDTKFYEGFGDPATTPEVTAGTLLNTIPNATVWVRYIAPATPDTVKVMLKDMAGNDLGSFDVDYNATVGSKYDKLVELADANTKAEPSNYTRVKFYLEKLGDVATTPEATSGTVFDKDTTIYVEYIAKPAPKFVNVTLKDAKGNFIGVSSVKYDSTLSNVKAALLDVAKAYKHADPAKYKDVEFYYDSDFKVTVMSGNRFWNDETLFVKYVADDTTSDNSGKTDESGKTDDKPATDDSGKTDSNTATKPGDGASTDAKADATKTDNAKAAKSQAKVESAQKSDDSLASTGASVMVFVAIAMLAGVAGVALRLVRKNL